MSGASTHGWPWVYLSIDVVLLACVVVLYVQGELALWIAAFVAGMYANGVLTGMKLMDS